MDDGLAMACLVGLAIAVFYRGAVDRCVAYVVGDEPGLSIIMEQKAKRRNR
jgi:hypothetical protein